MLFTAGLLLAQTVVQPAMAQMTISGTVRYAKSGETVAGANVIFQTPDAKKVYGFDITGADGTFLFEYNSSADSVRIMVTGFNLKNTFRIVRLPAKPSDLQVEFEETTIKEVVVRAEPVKRRGDTLSYIVSAYADSLVDRSIGGVLWTDKIQQPADQQVLHRGLGSDGRTLRSCREQRPSQGHRKSGGNGESPTNKGNGGVGILP